VCGVCIHSLRRFVSVGTRLSMGPVPWSRDGLQWGSGHPLCDHHWVRSSNDNPLAATTMMMVKSTSFE